MEYQNFTLKQIYFEAEDILGDAKAHFGHLNSRRLNWKPADDSWSVAQCLDHLISINGEYYPTFNRILNGGELSASLRNRCGGRKWHSDQVGGLARHK